MVYTARPWRELERLWRIDILWMALVPSYCIPFQCLLLSLYTIAGTGKIEKYVIKQLSSPRLTGFPVLPPEPSPRKMPVLTCTRGTSTAWQAVDDFIVSVYTQLGVDAALLASVHLTLRDCRCRTAKGLHIDGRLVSCEPLARIASSAPPSFPA